MATGIFRSLYDFKTETEKDLPLRRNDIVKVRKQINEEWCEGCTENDVGQFPISYVERVFTDEPVRLGVVLKTFNSEQEGDLALTKNEIVGIIDNLDENWMNGYTKYNKGIFPVSFIREIFFCTKSHNNNNNDDYIPWAEATDSFTAQDSDELTISKGMGIRLTKEIDNFWMEGIVDGKKGKFPKTFVRVLIDLPESLKSEKNDENDDSMESKAKARYMFVGTKSSELSFDKGDMITLLERINKDWLKGKIGNSIGLFPANHVEILIDLPFDKDHTSEQPVVVAARNKIKGHDTSSPNHSNNLRTTQTAPKPNQQRSYTETTRYLMENRNSSSSLMKSCAPRSKSLVSSPPLYPNMSVTAEGIKARDTSKKPSIAKKPTYLNNQVKSPNHLKNSYGGTNGSIDQPSLLKGKKARAPERPQSFVGIRLNNQDKATDLMSVSPPKVNRKRLPKPLAPMPAQTQQQQRPNTLNLDKNEISSPTSILDHNIMSAMFTKLSTDYENKLMTRSETDPQLHVTLNNEAKTPLTPDLGKSLFFSSTSTPSPERRTMTLDMMLQQSSSLRASNRSSIHKNESLDSPISAKGSTDSLFGSSQELKRMENEIAELKGKIEAEAHLLSGVETLLDFVAEEKRSDLILKRDQHNNNIVGLNEDLNALEDEKSFLLASFGKVDDVKNRISDLQEQIEMYLDNCEQLRRMQDVSVIEDLPEIRDNIEFCENMVDTLQDELNGLREKLGELNQTDSTPDPVKELEKQRKSQKRVIEELLKTERSYVRDISLVTTSVKKKLIENLYIDTNVLFGNLDVIVDLSKHLLARLEEANEDFNEDIPNKIAVCFIDLSSQMKECYATYCRNYDDAQLLLEKYEEDTAIQSQITAAVEMISVETGCFGLPSFLIKPVQRVLKYPLLLSELLKNHVEEGTEKETLRLSLNTVTDVAAAINEFKRRKDLVQKYRETEDGISKKVQKLNWHSVAKKSSRINQRITQFTGFNSQTVDEMFIDEEKKFKALEKIIKSFLKNILFFIEAFKENSMLGKQCAESIRQFHIEQEAGEEVIKYYSKTLMVAEYYAANMMTFVQQHVTDPLNQLLQLFQGPFRLIQKRNDKCLDYDRAKNKAARAKDSKERDKINQTQEELQMSHNIYSALNTQLLEELPSLICKSHNFVKYCLANFVEAYKRYLSNAYSQLHELWQLPFIIKDVEMYDRHQDLIQIAADQLSSLVFVPANTKEMNRQSTMQVIQSTIIKPNLFIDFFENVDDPTSPLKPDTSNDANQEQTMKEKSSETYDTQYVVKFSFEAEDSAELSALEGTVVNVLRKCDKNGNSEWWLVENDGKKGYIPEAFLAEQQKLLTRSVSDNDECNRRLKSDSMCSIGISVTEPVCSTQNQDFQNVSSPYGNREPTLLQLLHVGTGYREHSQNGEVFDHVDKSSEINSDINVSNSDVNVNNCNNNTDEHSKPDECYTVQYYRVEYDFEAVHPGELTVEEGVTVKIIRKFDQKGNEVWWFVEHDGRRGYVPREYLELVNEVQMC